MDQVKVQGLIRGVVGAVLHVGQGGDQTNKCTMKQSELYDLTKYLDKKFKEQNDMIKQEIKKLRETLNNLK